MEAGEVAWVQATFPLQTGSDQEKTLQALIRAAEMLKKRFERELDQLRQESDKDSRQGTKRGA